MSAAGLEALDPARRANVLRHFLATQGLAMPGESRLADMARQLVSAREDARILLLHGGRALVRHQGRIVVQEAPAGVGRLGRGRGRASASSPWARGGARCASRSRPGRASRWTAWAAGAGTSRPGRAGSASGSTAGGPTRTLKNLLQEHAVPVWRRPRLPLLFEGDTLVWVPGIGVAADYRARPAAPGLTPAWLPDCGDVFVTRPRNRDRYTNTSPKWGRDLARGGRLC